MKGFTRPTGTFAPTDKNQEAFVPHHLPPDLDLASLMPLVSEASYLIGGLNELGRQAPNPRLLIRPQLAREAVQSSRIEGSRVSLSDLYDYQTEGRGARDPDRREVHNYVRAMNAALERASDAADIDLNLINECHGILLEGVRGSEKMCGRLRTQQNWIGSERSRIEDADYVPPPPSRVAELMDDLIRFMSAPPPGMVPLVQCAVAHYQFETIHPYEDGNGRVGRMLIPLMLANRRLLGTPLLYISGYIEQNRAAYYDLLMGVRRNGDWTAWMRFFITAVIHQARTSVGIIKQLEDLRQSYHDRIKSRRISNALRIIDLLFEYPRITRKMVEGRLGVTNVTAAAGLERLKELGILSEVGTGRAKVYLAHEILDLLEAGA